MHPRTQDLLSIRDGVADARWREHIEQCGECAAHLAELERTRAALRALPPLEPSISWSDLEARLHSSVEVRPRRRALGTIVGLAIAASVAALAVFVSTHRTEVGAEATPQLAALPTPHASTTTDVASLIERSRQLDVLLQAMPQRPRTERVSMAATLDTMEERIQWLDYQLSYAAGDLDALQSQRLWQERVELMDSLVKVRYAQSRTASF